MATTFKTFLNDDVASTRTLLHEAIPLTGGILFGTYTEPGVALSNVKVYTHGMFQSVYDYSYTKSSANHIFDLSAGVTSATGSDASDLTVVDTVAAMATKKNMIYNEFAKILAGHDETGAIRQFDEDGDLTAGDKIKEFFVISIARLLNKDEIKKGSFYLDLDVTEKLPVATCSVGGRDGAVQATVKFGGIGQASGLEDDDSTTLIITNTDGTTVTFTTDDSKIYSASDATTIGTDNLTTATLATQSLHVAFTAAIDAGTLKASLPAWSGTPTSITLTQLVAGFSGNKTITGSMATGSITVNGSAYVDGTSAFGSTGSSPGVAGTNGTRYELRISDSGAATDYRINSPAGDYGILKCDTYKKIVLANDAACTASTTTTIDYAATLDAKFVHNSVSANNLDRTAGLIFYQAGVVILNPFVFERYEDVETTGGYATGGTHDGRLPPVDLTAFSTGKPKMTSTSASVEAVFQAQSIDACSTALRSRINKLAFNNTTELNSTIYFCRVGHNDFNYSSNPTYLDSSKIRVKEKQSDAPVSYITSVGLYSADNELLAVAKLSEALRKDPTNEMVLRVRLDY